MYNFSKPLPEEDGCTYLTFESLCKTMLSFSSILESSPFRWSKFTVVLNQGSLEQLSRNEEVKAAESVENNFMYTNAS